MNQMIPDPMNPSIYFIGSAAEADFGQQVGDAVLVDVHDSMRCGGRSCVVHNPSNHHMRTWPLNWRDDRGLMERTCPHGIGHPDPDSIAFHAQMEALGEPGHGGMGSHGCDGCCSEPSS